VSVPGTVRRGGSALLALAAAGLTSSLAFAAPAAPDDIRDIRGLIAIRPWWHWPLAIALAAAAALAVVLVLRWWRARSTVALSPLDLARRALETAEVHARAGRTHEWADIVAETTRGALAVRLGTDVLPQTTAELSQATWTHHPLAGDIDAARIVELLETCDLARFAKARLDENALLASTATARELTERLFAPPSHHAPGAAAHPQTVTP
jgi:hypothetical protein